MRQRGRFDRNRQEVLGSSGEIWDRREGGEGDRGGLRTHRRDLTGNDDPQVEDSGQWADLEKLRPVERIAQLILPRFSPTAGRTAIGDVAAEDRWTSPYAATHQEHRAKD